MCERLRVPAQHVTFVCDSPHVVGVVQAVDLRSEFVVWRRSASGEVGGLDQQELVEGLRRPALPAVCPLRVVSCCEWLCHSSSQMRQVNECSPCISGLRLADNLIRQVTGPLAFVISLSVRAMNVWECFPLKPVDPCVAATWGTDLFLLILPFLSLPREVSAVALGKIAEHLRFTFRNAIPLASDFKGLGESRVPSPPAQPPWWLKSFMREN